MSPVFQFVQHPFSLGVTAEALRANIGWKSAISLQRGPVDQKFQVGGVAPTNHSSSQKTRLNDLSYGIKIWTDLYSVLSQCTRSQGISHPAILRNGLNHICLCLPSRSWYSFTSTRRDKRLSWPENWQSPKLCSRLCYPDHHTVCLSWCCVVCNSRMSFVFRLPFE